MIIIDIRIWILEFMYRWIKFDTFDGKINLNFALANSVF